MINQFRLPQKLSGCLVSPRRFKTLRSDLARIGRLGFVLTCCALGSELLTSLHGFANPNPDPESTQSVVALPGFDPQKYNPAVIHLRFTQAEGRTSSADSDAFLDITLIPSSGDVEGFRVELSSSVFRDQLRQLYMQLSRLESLNEDNPESASRQIHALIFGGLKPVLEAKKVTTLLIAADRGLQAVPFAALHDGEQFLGDRYAFAITPSLALTDFEEINKFSPLALTQYVQIETTKGY
mgnify:FL=1